MHDFKSDLKWSHEQSDQPWWEEVYRAAFPDFVAMHDVRQDGWAQRGGIDRQIVLEDGTVLRSGRLPVNASGGLKAKGHPIGATGVSMHVVSAMQLMGEAGDLQVPGATLAGVFNMGGSAVANYVSILERAR